MEAFQVLQNADEGGGVTCSGKKCYEDLQFNVISVTRGCAVFCPGFQKGRVPSENDTLAR